MIDFPSSPTLGQEVTSPVGIVWQWDGSAWVIVAGGVAMPAAVPRGVVAFAQRVNGISTVDASEVVALSVTFTAVAGRRYKASAHWSFNLGLATDTFFMNLRSGVNQLQSSGHGPQSSAGGARFGELTHITNASLAGAQTWTLGLQRTGGTSIASTVAGTTNPTFLLVEDIGLL